MPSTWVQALRDAEELREWMGFNDPQVVILGALVSSPPLVPYRLLRQARRALFGPTTLHLEAALCDSDMVEAASKDGLELEPRFLSAARSLVRERVLIGEIPAEELRVAVNCDDLGLSPLLALEEHLVWTYLSESDPIPHCDQLLANCLLTVVREDRLRILDWAAGSLRRLPEPVLAAPSAWLLSEVCNALSRDTRRLQPPRLESMRQDLLQEVLKLVPQGLVGFERDGKHLTLGPISFRRRLAFPVPRIAFQPIIVTWLDEKNVNHEVVIDALNGVSSVPVGGRAVQVRNAAGGTLQLAAFQPDAAPPEVTAFEANLDLLEEAWRERRPLAARVISPLSASGAVVRFLDAWTVSGYLRHGGGTSESSEGSEVVRGDVEVRITNFDRRLQRVICEPATTSWSWGDLAIRAEVDGEVVASRDFGILVRVPTTQLGLVGRSIIGLAHTSTFPPQWRRNPPRLRPGDSVRVQVIEIDEERQRLSLRVLEDINRLLSMHTEGSVMTGVVETIRLYGVFITLPTGLTALLHNSEIAADRTLAVGDAIEVTILTVDHAMKRLRLGSHPPLPPGSPSRPADVDSLTPDEKPLLPSIKPEELGDAGKFMRRILRTIEEPINLSNLAHHVRSEVGPLVADDWMGYDTFKLMLQGLVPEVIIDLEGPGHAHPLSGS